MHITPWLYTDNSQFKIGREVEDGMTSSMLMFCKNRFDKKLLGIVLNIYSPKKERETEPCTDLLCHAFNGREKSA